MEKLFQPRKGDAVGDVVYVQLGRRGDIVNILPLMLDCVQSGNKVYCLVHSEFVSVLDAVTYVTPIVWEGSQIDIKGACDFIKEKMPSAKVYASQISGAFEPCHIPFRNFALEGWHRAGGKLGDYHRFPLEFDAPRNKVLRTSTTRIGIAIAGYSSEFARGNEFKTWLKHSVGDSAEIVDLDQPLNHVKDLIPLVESCDFCILNDSLPLHISYAFQMGVIAILRSVKASKSMDEASWSSTEPRRHWIAAMYQEECLTNVGRTRIASILEDFLGVKIQDYKPTIVQVVDLYPPNDPEEHRRMERAKDSWDRQKVLDGHWGTWQHQRTRSSKDFKDSRDLPFLKDMLDQAANRGDIAVLTNSDTIVHPDAGEVIRERCNPCCYSARSDITRSGDVIGTYKGVDLIAVQSWWWKQNRNKYPDLLLGCEGWDAIIWMWFDEVNSKARIEPPIISHEIHASFWNQPENHIDNIGQRYNRALTTLWMIENGKQHYFGSGNCLVNV